MLDRDLIAFTCLSTIIAFSVVNNVLLGAVINSLSYGCLDTWGGDPAGC